jgi:hypothetical protein
MNRTFSFFSDVKQTSSAYVQAGCQMFLDLKQWSLFSRNQSLHVRLIVCSRILVHNKYSSVLFAYIRCMISSKNVGHHFYSPVFHFFVVAVNLVEHVMPIDIRSSTDSVLHKPRHLEGSQRIWRHTSYFHVTELRAMNKHDPRVAF